MKDIIILVGFMGTGKSAVGQALAAELDCPYFDTDLLVEKKTGLSIARIFESRGEDYFRDLESAVIQELFQEEEAPFVLATGGGILLREKNRLLLEEMGLLVNLTASRDEILTRIGKGEARPLLSSSNRKKKIEALLKERAMLYEPCHQKIDTSGKTIEEVTQEIIKELNLK